MGMRDVLQNLFQTNPSSNNESDMMFANFPTSSYGTANDEEKHPVLEESSTYSTDSSSEASLPGSPQRQGKSSNKNKSSLTILQLAVLIFYSVSGGPFGMEESVRAAGPFYTLLGCLVAPLIFSVPECLMTVELSSGGFASSAAGCAWVEEAFGNTAGFLTGYLQWVSGVTDNAIYPVLFLEYLLQVFPNDTLQSDEGSNITKYMLITSISVGLSYLNWLGLDLVGNMSIVVCGIAMSPFVLLMMFGATKVDPELWFQVPTDFMEDISNSTMLDNTVAAVADDDDMDMEGGFFPNLVLGGVLLRPFLNNLFWNFNSFDNAGSFAEDVREPSRVVPRAMLWGLIMVVLGYILPMLVALGTTDAAPSEWVDGYLATVCTETVGPWLGQWLVLAAALSNIGLFQAELSADAYMLMGMAERGYLPQFLAQRNPKTGTPTYSLFLGTMVIVVMGVSNLDSLIEMLNFNYALALIMEYAAFLKLRISKPDVDRPYKVPLGTFGCAIALIPTIMALVAVIALASYTTICVNAVTITFGILAYTLTRRMQASNQYERVPAMSFDV
ncbi:Probable polyamine transporter At3g19553 [Seminavis robusta]|uniref:Probable polyamine transporter At3g19553 n=1 Tax=Seminavis robusta TaxID=568900 RepID=A0A9N8DU50_9STRA|nr:Probable polyamine transporter At3g19553 [Seminavis robusta]|eukprot:Sro373_g129030.1 Probable polyamine transporter At3g19553 (557) ;mRNA; f:40516-42277